MTFGLTLLGLGDLTVDFRCQNKSLERSHGSGDPCMQAVPNGKQFNAWLLKEQNICSARNPLDELKGPRGHDEGLIWSPAKLSVTLELSSSPNCQRSKKNQPMGASSQDQTCQICRFFCFFLPEHPLCSLKPCKLALDKAPCDSGSLTTFGFTPQHRLTSYFCDLPE